LKQAGEDKSEVIVDRETDKETGREDTEIEDRVNVPSLR